MGVFMYLCMIDMESSEKIKFKNNSVDDDVYFDKLQKLQTVLLANQPK
jgi:hypothetical protein